MATKITVDISSRFTRLAMPDDTALPASMKRALDRQSILERWERAKAAEGPEIATRKTLTRLRRAGKPIGRSTLYAWDEKYRRSGLAGLVDGRVSRHKDALDETCLQLLADYLERLNSQALAMVTVFASMLAARRGMRKAKLQSHLETGDKEAL